VQPERGHEALLARAACLFARYALVLGRVPVDPEVAGDRTVVVPDGGRDQLDVDRRPILAEGGDLGAGPVGLEELALERVP
jgi:hypothetical protein